MLIHFCVYKSIHLIICYSFTYQIVTYVFNHSKFSYSIIFSSIYLLICWFLFCIHFYFYFFIYFYILIYLPYISLYLKTNLLFISYLVRWSTVEFLVVFLVLITEIILSVISKALSYLSHQNGNAAVKNKKKIIIIKKYFGHFTLNEIPCGKTGGEYCQVRDGH